MKKKRSIYIALAAIYSLVAISIFAYEIKICISDDHIGFKSLESSCCESGNTDSYNEDKDDCLDLKFVFSQNTGQHLGKQTNTKRYSFQNELTSFLTIPFFGYIKNYKYQYTYLANYKTELIQPSSNFLHALRTVSLLL